MTADLPRDTTLARYYESILDLSPAAIVTADNEIRVTSWNPAAERLFGYTPEEAIGKPIDDLIASGDDVRAEASSFNRRAQETGRLHAVTRRMDRDGHLVDVELNVAPVIRDGEQIGVIAIYHDISELQAQKEYFGSLTDVSPTAVVIIDTHGIVTRWNPAAEQLFGYTAAEALGRHIDDLVATDPVLREEALEVTREAIRNQASLVTRRMRKDGTLVDVQVRAAPITIAGENVGAYALYHDISELVEARRTADAATAAKSAFLATMSHEIRTPMNAVIGMTGLLLDTDLSDEQHEYAETIRTSGEALLTIINDILDFSKIEAGRVELEAAPFAPHRIIEGALDVLAPTAASKGVELAYEPGPDLPAALVGDAGRLRQIILNLLSNAVKFTDVGEVVLSVDGRSVADGRQELTIEVRDTGIGIPPERMDRLFQSFSQVDASVSRRYGGTGLGLAISRRLAELMGGSLTASSDGVPGHGTTFTLVMRAPVAEAGSVPITIRETGVLAGKRAVVVDDNATNRRILEIQLRRWGLEARSTDSPREALEWVGAGEPFEIALLDLHMDEMDGVALAAALRELRPRSPIPVIILSSVGGSERGDPSIIASLTKPVKPSSLHDLLAEVFGAAPAPPRPPASTVRDGVGRLADEHPLRILLAEDNVMNRRLVLILLERMGYTADVATNGREAVVAVERTTYDVVLMDLQMPEVDGLEATRRIREHWDGAGPRIVALTANAMAEDREMTLAAGMDDYLSKPIRPAELAEALRRSSARTDA